MGRARRNSQARYPFLRTVRHRTQRGIADALRTGYLDARGDVLVFYPADLQFKPEDIPRLVAPILAGEADMVTGFKQGKYEKAFVSGIYNGLSRLLFDVPRQGSQFGEGLPARDHGRSCPCAPTGTATWSSSPPPRDSRSPRSRCRYIPGTPANRSSGSSRIPVGVLDMLSVWFELRFGKKPLLSFGMLGAALFGVGVIAGLTALGWLLVKGEGVRSVWTVIQTCLILGSVFFATGLLGEQIAGQRAEVRELRRRLEEMAAERDAGAPR